MAEFLKSKSDSLLDMIYNNKEIGDILESRQDMLDDKSKIALNIVFKDNTFEISGFMKYDYAIQLKDKGRVQSIIITDVRTQLGENLKQFKNLKSIRLVDYIHTLGANEIPSSVTQLICDDIGLETLQYLPNIVNLNCSKNKITKLPELPNVLKLDCSHNKITKLPELPNVVKLDCSHNEITKLPKLPNVVNLECNSNKILVLPELPKVVNLNCGDNKLEYLPELPKLKELVCTNNGIQTLPHIPKINFLMFDTYNMEREEINKSTKNLRYVSLSDGHVLFIRSEITGTS